MVCDATVFYPYIIRIDRPLSDESYLHKLDLNVRKFNDSVAKHGADKVGRLEDHGNVFEIKDLWEARLCQMEIEYEHWLDFVCDPDEDEADSVAGQLVETVNLEALRSYAGEGIDDQQEVLDEYLARLEREGEDVPGKPGHVSLKVTYKRKHGLPGASDSPVYQQEVSSLLRL